MNDSASCGVSAPAADSTQSLSADCSDVLTDPRAGWSSAYDVCTLLREAGEWGVTFASSIKRAIAAGDTQDAERLACIQQFVFDHIFSNAETETSEALRNMGALDARSPR